MYKIILISLLILINACTMQPILPAGGHEEVENLESSAVSNLLSSAQNDLDNQSYTYAESKLERSLRIEPQNARVWYKLAEVAYLQNNFSLAENIANRALRYVTKNSQTEKSIIRLLETIKSM